MQSTDEQSSAGQGTPKVEPVMGPLGLKSIKNTRNLKLKLIKLMKYPHKKRNNLYACNFMCMQCSANGDLV